MILFVITTLPDEASAARIIQTLVEKKSAACGTILPGVRSIYRWKDSVEDAAEVLVLFKIPAASAQTFIAELKSLHPYETPEIAAFEAAHVHQAYAKWVLESCAA